MVSTMGVVRSGLAYRLGIAEGTVKKHVNALLAKTGSEPLPALVNGVLRSAMHLDPS